MKPSDATLLAYVDGKLDPEERKRVEGCLAEDPEARDMVQRLAMVAAEDIKECLSVSALEPLPLDLARRIQEMPAPQADQPVHREAASSALKSGPGPAPQSSRARWRSSGWAMAASVAMLVLGGAIGLWAGSHYGQSQVIADNPAVAEKSWMVGVAEYQKLYVRDTVNNVRLSGTEQAAANARLSGLLGRDVSPPDLSDHDLTYKRGQLLDFDGRPIVQLVYLPNEGKPIALCIITSDNPDHAPEDGAAEGLNFTHWARGGYGYILIGEADPGRIRAMAEEARRQI